MRALERCDFCDDEAVGTFETVPSELATAGLESRRIVLCAECRALLEEVLEPLLSYVSEDSVGVDPTSVDRASDDASSSGPETDAEAITFEDARGESTSGEPIGTDSGETGADPERTEAGAEGTDADVRKMEVTADAERTDDGRADDESENRPEDPSNEDDAPPEGYGKVLRLLGNREFPMDRAAVESLAAGAYDLESHEVEAVLEYAIERGEFLEDGGQLKRP